MTIIEQLEQFVCDECDRVDVDRAYDDMLDECYDLSVVGGPFAGMLASRVLKEVDPTAYRCGKNDWLDGEEVSEVGGEYYRDDDVDKAKDQFVDELESKAADLETEIEELEADEDPDLKEVASKKRELADLQADIKTVEKHAF